MQASQNRVDDYRYPKGKKLLTILRAGLRFLCKHRLRHSF